MKELVAVYCLQEVVSELEIQSKKDMYFLVNFGWYPI